MISLIIAKSSANGDVAGLVGLEGQAIDYQDVVAEPQTVIFVWTTWCPYCRIQLDNIAKQCSYPGVKLVLLNSGETKKLVERFIKRQKISNCIKKKIVLDKSSSVAKKFSISGFPTFIFLKNGKYLARSYYFNKGLLEKIY